jgi:hypothetical protein
MDFPARAAGLVILDFGRARTFSVFPEPHWLAAARIRN